MLSLQQSEQLRGAFIKGALKVPSMTSNGVVEWQPITAVHRAAVPWEQVLSFELSDGSSFVVTAGHRVYVDNGEAVEAQELTLGCQVRAFPEDKQILGCTSETRSFMFDVTVSENHNLILYRSGVVVHNCPDRNYHFRPPEHEADVGAYNRVFGYVWEDNELLTYLRQAVDWWDMFPPRTSVKDLNKLTSENPTWRTAIQYGGMMFALLALAINWVHDEFDYSIGGVSLSLEKSSKYESLKSNAEQQFDKATEAKARTVKYIRGLQQPRYGVGIRSAFGPHVGRGVLSPRNFL